MVRILFASVIILATTGISSAQSILVDNFNTGVGGSTIALTLSVPNTSVFQFDNLLTTTIGGQRIARLHDVAGSGTINLNNTVNPDVLGMSLPSSATIQAHFHIYYGYDSYDSSATSPVANTHVFRDLNTDTTILGVPQFTFDVNRLDVVPSTLHVILVSNRGLAGEAFRQADISINSSIFGPTTINVSQAQFAAGTGSGTLNWADIDQIIFETGNLIDSTDLRVDNLRFTAVPEPATMALLGLTGVLSIGGVWYRRRRNQKIQNLSISGM